MSRAGGDGGAGSRGGPAPTWTPSAAARLPPPPPPHTHTLNALAIRGRRGGARAGVDAGRAYRDTARMCGIWTPARVPVAHPDTPCVCRPKLPGSQCGMLACPPRTCEAAPCTGTAHPAGVCQPAPCIGRLGVRGAAIDSLWALMSAPRKWRCCGGPRRRGLCVRNQKIYGYDPPPYIRLRPFRDYDKVSGGASCVPARGRGRGPDDADNPRRRRGAGSARRRRGSRDGGVPLASPLARGREGGGVCARARPLALGEGVCAADGDAPGEYGPGASARGFRKWQSSLVSAGKFAGCGRLAARRGRACAPAKDAPAPPRPSGECVCM